MADGRLTGWVGGHCARPVVVHQALAALHDGAPRLIVLGPDGPPDGHADDEADDASAVGGAIVRAPMRCAAQGELQIFVEPFLPRLELVVVGASPVAVALARLGALLDFEVWACDPDAEPTAFPAADRLLRDLDELASQLTPCSCVVVATFGLYDEQAVQLALASPAAYVGLIASRRRLEAMRADLRTAGVPEERLGRLQRPQGLPGRALLPAEIAFSAMAELLGLRRGIDRAGEGVGSPPDEATDPICGMTVQVATARYVTRRAGRTYYFCCAGCQARFEAAE
jgi:xanthine dehydrogenase accessory factor